MSTCRKDPMDPAYVTKVTQAILAATALTAVCHPRRNPKTGGLAVRVSAKGRVAWLSCEHGGGELAHRSYDADGRLIEAPDFVDFYMHSRLTTQAQVVACHLLGQRWERRR